MNLKSEQEYRGFGVGADENWVEGVNDFFKEKEVAGVYGNAAVEEGMFNKICPGGVSQEMLKSRKNASSKVKTKQKIEISMEVVEEFLM